MQAKFICHKDFAARIPRPVFYTAGSREKQNDEPQYQNRHILFRRTFSCAPFSRAVLRITADDYFKLYVNGKFVAQGPPQGYPSRYYYMETDLTDVLAAGENTIAVHAYYQGLCNRALVSGDARQCLWAELYIDGALYLATDEQWRIADHTGYTACGVVGYDTAFCERYDSGANEIGFERADFNDSSWAYASVLASADYTLVPSPLRPLSIYDRPPKACRTEKSKITLDFGQEMVGCLRIEAQGEKGGEVTVRYGEELNADGSVRYRLRCNCVYEDRWGLSGGHDLFEPFECKAFRYVEILFPPHTRIRTVYMRVQHYPCEAKTVYEAAGDLKKVLTLCENTVRYGVQEAFYDCPTREKGQYLGDLCVSGRAHAALTQDVTLLKKALEDFAESSRICPGLMAVAPAAFMQEIADYSLLFPALVQWVYATCGDLAFVERMLPCVEGVLAYFKQFAREDGLLEGAEKWNLVDWPEGARDSYDFALTQPIGRGVHNVLNAFWIGCLQAADALYALTGKARLQEIDALKARFFAAFYDEKRGLFCDSEKKTHAAYHSNVLPLLFDIGTQDETLKKRLIDFICKKGLRAGSVYFAYFALAALVKHGEREKAVALVTAPDAWPGMLKEGATTTFEAWRKGDKWNSSLCHPWATAPLVVFCKDFPPY